MCTSDVALNCIITYHDTTMLSRLSTSGDNGVHRCRHTTKHGQCPMPLVVIHLKRNNICKYLP